MHEQKRKQLEELLKQSSFDQPGQQLITEILKTLFPLSDEMEDPQG
jgi:hypothetical protein